MKHQKNEMSSGQFARSLGNAKGKGRGKGSTSSHLKENNELSNLIHYDNKERSSKNEK